MRMPSRPVNYRAVTQRDIARALGISNATVSLALRDSELLPRARCEEVQAAARSMGYQANVAAAELACYKSSSRVAPTRTALAWLDIRRSSAKKKSGRASDACRDGVKSAASHLGYHFEEVVVNGESPRRLHRKFQKTGIRGILLPTAPPSSEWETFPWEDYAMVRFGRSSAKPLCHGVDHDHVANAMLAFTKMRERGYKRIGLLSSGAASTRASDLQNNLGVLIAREQMAGSRGMPLCVLNPLAEPNPSRSLVKWVRANELDGIVTDLPDSAEMLAAGGLRIPEDLGLAFTHASRIPGAAGVLQSPVEIGKAALSLLSFLITCFDRETPGSPRQLLVTGQWVDGGTLPLRR